MSQSKFTSRGAVHALCAGALTVALSLAACSAGGSSTGGSLGGKTSLTESELNSTIATYTYNGKAHELSARDVILETSSLDSMKNDDDTYQVPNADSVISVARNKIVSAEAESQGITISDEDLATYAEDTLGTNDFSSIASSYSMDEDSVKSLLRESAQMSKLREQKVGEDTSTAPEAPTAAEEGKEAEPTAEYAQYIISLAGDEWDAANKKWASEDGDFATAMSSYQFNGETATYEAAESAYYAAYQKYSEKQSELSEQWTEFVNSLLANASISISTLVA